MGCERGTVLYRYVPVSPSLRYSLLVSSPKYQFHGLPGTPRLLNDLLVCTSMIRFGVHYIVVRTDAAPPERGSYTGMISWLTKLIPPLHDRPRQWPWRRASPSKKPTKSVSLSVSSHSQRTQHLQTMQTSRQRIIMPGSATVRQKSATQSNSMVRFMRQNILSDFTSLHQENI